MPTKLLLQDAKSQLVIIDLQVKLEPAMDWDAMQAVTKICSILLQVARLMQVHTIVTKQYSEGLGKTLPELKQYLTNIKLIVKTELGLLQANKQVFLVEDAAISRSPTNKANAIARLLDVGCIITNSESVVFERLGDSNHEAFKAISKLIR